MPLSTAMKRLAEQEVYSWITETGARLHHTGHMKDQIRELTAETLYRRLQNKYPVEMAIFTFEDMATSVFEDGDTFNTPTPRPSTKVEDEIEEEDQYGHRDYDDYRDEENDESDE